MVYELATLRVDTVLLTISERGKLLPLGPKVVRALATLCDSAGEVVSRDALIADVWGGNVVDVSSLWQTIHVLRQTLSTYGAPNAIENARGRGYRLTGPVHVLVPTRARTYPKIAAIAARLIAVALALFFPAPTFHAIAPLAGESERLYNLGRHYFSIDTEPALVRAEVILEKLVRREPGSAKAHAALAETLIELAGAFQGNHSASGRRALERARSEAQIAWQLDPDSAEGNDTRASIAELSSDRFGVADAVYRRAIAVDPLYVPARQRYGSSLLLRGRVDEAVEQLKVAVQLEPASAAANAALAYAYYVKRAPHDAMPFAAAALENGDDPDDGHVRLGLIYAQGHRFNSAIAEFDKLHCCPRLSAALIAQVYAQDGEPERAHALLQRVRGRDMPSFVWRNLAFAHILLAERAAALQAFGHLPPTFFAERSMLAVDPRMDSVRGDRRFAPFLQVSSQ